MSAGWIGTCALAVAIGLLGWPAAVAHAEDTESPASESPSEDRVEALEEQVSILAEELGRLKSIFAVPEDFALQSFSGLGPAASKVYGRDRGLSIGGYGEVRLRSFHNKDNDSGDDVFDALRAVLYVGYKFNDKWVLNSELEFEHGGTGGGGSVSTEFLTIDYLHRDELNVRVGLLLIPMGFVNEIHEPTFYFGAERPEVERTILPSTWRENGAGIFGSFADRVHYRAYVVNGFDGKDFSSSGLRGGRQSGSRAISNDFAFVGRIDVDVVNGLLVGGSVYTGQTGQSRTFTSAIDGVGRDLPDAHLTVYELHAQYRGYGLSLRGLWTQAFLDQAGRLSRATDRNYIDLDPNAGVTRGLNPLDRNDSIAGRMQGYYVEAAYDVLPHFLPETKASLEPYFRYESYDTQKHVQQGYTQDGSKDVELYVAGLQFKPIPQVVFKVDYRNFNLRQGSRPDEVQAHVGYVF